MGKYHKYILINYGIYNIIIVNICKVVKKGMETLVNRMLDMLSHTIFIAGFNNINQGISASKINIMLTKGK